MPKTSWNYEGIFPAMQCPFHDDFSIDEEELRRFTSWLSTHKGIGGLVPNGHTGEVFALTAAQRAEVTRIVVDQIKGKLPVISGLCCEGITEAKEHALMARDSGASGLLVMPPHYWLRFGMRPSHVIDYFTAIGETSELDLVAHVYPAWCKAAYSEEVLAQLCRLPWVKGIKLGTRDLNKYARDIKAIRNSNASVKILTCHDEYLLPTMVQGVDGALVGFASFIPEMITELYRMVCDGELKAAMEMQMRINPLKDAVYGIGEPTGDAHARMKAAMVLSGRMKSAVVQPPIQKTTGSELDLIREALNDAGLLLHQAAE